MKDFFFQLLINSAVAGCVIFILMVTARLWRRRTYARVRYWIWLVIALRFVLPFSLPQSAAVVIQVNDPTLSALELRLHIVQPTIGEVFEAENLAIDAAPVIADTTQVQSDKTHVSAQNAISHALAQNSTFPVSDQNPASPALAIPQFTLIQLLICLWGIGMIAVLIWRAVAYIRFRRFLKHCLSPCQNIGILARTDELKAEMNIPSRVRVMMNCVQSTPFLTGFFRPLLVLPEGVFDDRQLTFVLRHELIHLKRRDLWYKLLLQIVAAINWFNPMAWLMLAMAVQDMEQACDTDVVDCLGIEDRRNYVFVLLKIAENNLYTQTVFTTNMSGSTRMFKERIIEIMNTNKKRGGTLVATAVMLSLMVFGGIFGFSMPEKDIEENSISGTATDSPEEAEGEVLVEEKTVVESDLRTYTRTVDGKDYSVIENELIRIYLPAETELSPHIEKDFMQYIDWVEEAAGLDTLTNLIYHYRFYDNPYMTETELENWLGGMDGPSRRINALWSDNSNQKEDTDIRLGFYCLFMSNEGRSLRADSTGIYISPSYVQVSQGSYDNKGIDTILRSLSYVAFLRSVDSLGGWFYNRPFADGFVEWATIKAERKGGLDGLLKENLNQLELSTINDIEDYFTTGWISDNKTDSPKTYQYGYVFLTYLEEVYGSDIFKEIIKELDSKEYAYPSNADDSSLPYNSELIVNTIKAHTSEDVFKDCIEWFNKNRDAIYK